MTPTRVRETTVLGAVAKDSDKQTGRFEICIIEGDRWGSSGYYPANVVERDGPSVFGSGTQIFLDHPTESEMWDRPERSVRDIAGVISSTPTWNAESKQLMAEATFFGPYIDLIHEIAPHVGMSINALAEQEAMKIGEEFGPVTTRFVEALSVDVVTRAGAGGAIIKPLIESARTKFLAGQSSGEPVKESEQVAELNDKLLADLTASLTLLNTNLTADAVAREAQATAAREAAEAAAEAGKTDPLDLVGVLAEAKLPKAYSSRVIEAVKLGVAPDVAVKAAKDELEAVLKEAGFQPAAPAGHIGAPQGAGAAGATGTVLPNGLTVDISEARVNRALGRKVAS